MPRQSVSKWAEASRGFQHGPELIFLFLIPWDGSQRGRSSALAAILHKVATGRERRRELSEWNTCLMWQFVHRLHLRHYRWLVSRVATRCRSFAARVWQNKPTHCRAPVSGHRPALLCVSLSLTRCIFILEIQRLIINLQS